MTAHQPTDYVWIAIWGSRLGSYDYYVKGQQVRAAEARAPLDAIYERTERGERTGEWVTAPEVTSPLTRAQLEDAAQRRGIPVPEWAS